MKTFLYMLLLAGLAGYIPCLLAATNSADKQNSTNQTAPVAIKQDAGHPRDAHVQTQTPTWPFIVITLVAFVAIGGILWVISREAKRTLQIDDTLSNLESLLIQIQAELSRKFTPPPSTDPPKERQRDLVLSEIASSTRALRSDQAHLLTESAFNKAIADMSEAWCKNLEILKSANVFNDQQQRALAQLVQFSNRTQELDKILVSIDKGISTANTGLANLNEACVVAESKLERERTEAERKSNEALKDEISVKQTALEKQKREINLAVEERNKAIARETALREENQKRLEEARRENAQAAEERKAATANRTAAEETRAKFQEEKRQVEQLTRALWPDAFAENGPLAESRREIQTAVWRESVEAGTLLAALFRFRVLSRSGNTHEMPDVLSDLSRCAYRYWKSLGLNQERAAAAAKSWADALTAQTPKPFSIQVAIPGMPKEVTWMNYKPGGPPQLAEVETWAILNERNIAVKKADVV